MDIDSCLRCYNKDHQRLCNVTKQIVDNGKNNTVDINPAAPIHILVIPKKHISMLTDLKKEDELLIGKIYTTINKIAEQEGFKDQGYRVIANCGKDSGQEVMHIHFHILGGRPLGEKIV